MITVRINGRMNTVAGSPEKFILNNPNPSENPTAIQIDDVVTALGHSFISVSSVEYGDEGRV